MSTKATACLPLTYSTCSIRPWLAGIPVSILQSKSMSIPTMSFVPSCASAPSPRTRSHPLSKIKVGQFHGTQPRRQQLHDNDGILSTGSPDTVRLALGSMNPWTHFSSGHNSHKASQRFHVGHADLCHNRGISERHDTTFPIEQPRSPCQVGSLHSLYNALSYGDCQWR